MGNSNSQYEEEAEFNRLQQVLVNVKPSKWKWKKIACPLYPTEDCNEVYPRIFVGNVRAAKNKQYLRSLQITHVLNAAHGNKFGQINTGPCYYDDAQITYYGMDIMDDESVRIFYFFRTAADFIESAIHVGKILVHCMMGISRSATIVCAYLMIKRGMTAEQALTTLRRCREVRPNDGFLYDLIQLDKELRMSRN